MTEWQPISTAPKDGTRIILFGSDGVDVGEWQDTMSDVKESGVVVDPGADAGWWGLSLYFAPQIQPTHWMPLPDPPKSDVSPT